jgi:hypothetical protein
MTSFVLVGYRQRLNRVTQDLDFTGGRVREAHDRLARSNLHREAQDEG